MTQPASRIADNHTAAKRLAALLVAILLMALLSNAFSQRAGTHIGEGVIAKAAAPVTKEPLVTRAKLVPPEATADLLARGKDVFAKQCSACHGDEGKGDGRAAFILFPKPRNLTTRTFRLTSNNDGIVAVEDIFQTLTRGMPGSAMPSWELLSEQDRWAVAHYIKTFAKKDKKTPVAIEPTPEPAISAERLAHGRQLFLQSCAACHGPSGRGDGAQEQVDSDGRPIKPRDLTKGIFKGGRESNQIYMRIACGMPGSPMPAHIEALKPPDIWDLVHYVQGLSGIGAEMSVPQRMKNLTAEKTTVAGLDDPKNEAWQKVPPTYLSLMPLWWRDNRPEGVNVRLAYDDANIYIHTTWEDPTNDATQLQAQSFRDGFAIQLTGEVDPLFFAMGQQGAAEVKVWLWKADRQNDAAGRKDVQTAHPNMYVATYPSMVKAPNAGEEMGVDYGGKRDARTSEAASLDPKFLTALGVGNIVPSLDKSSTESLTARGFGSLGSRPSSDKGVSAVGEWKTGIYSLVFKRPLKQDGDGAINLAPGRTYHLAFACWDGSAGDRNGQKNVTIWHKLQLGK